MGNALVMSPTLQGNSNKSLIAAGREKGRFSSSGESALSFVLYFFRNAAVFTVPFAFTALADVAMTTGPGIPSCSSSSSPA